MLPPQICLLSCCSSGLCICSCSRVNYFDNLIGRMFWLHRDNGVITPMTSGSTIIVAEANPFVRSPPDRLSHPRLELWSRSCNLFPPEPPSPLRSGQPPASLPAMAFSLPVAVHPSLVCIPLSPMDSPTHHLLPISPGKTRLPFFHPDPHPHPPPLPRAMPISRLSFRWQRQTKGVCPSQKTLALNSLLAMYDPLRHPPRCTNDNLSCRIEFAGRILKIFFARPGPSSGQMSL